MAAALEEGDVVEKTEGDYRFRGVVVSVFRKWDEASNSLSGPQRVVVQNENGILHIFNPRQLTHLG